MPCVLNWFCGIFRWHIVSYKAHRKWVIRVNLPFRSAKITISFFTIHFRFSPWLDLTWRFGCSESDSDRLWVALLNAHSSAWALVCYIIYTLIEFTSAENGANLLIIAFIIMVYSFAMLSARIFLRWSLLNDIICMECKSNSRESTSFQHIWHVSPERSKYTIDETWLSPWCWARNYIKPVSIFICHRIDNDESSECVQSEIMHSLYSFQCMWHLLSAFESLSEREIMQIMSCSLSTHLSCRKNLELYSATFND